MVHTPPSPSHCSAASTVQSEAKDPLQTSNVSTCRCPAISQMSSWAPTAQRASQALSAKKSDVPANLARARNPSRRADAAVYPWPEHLLVGGYARFVGERELTDLLCRHAEVHGVPGAALGVLRREEPVTA